MALVSHDDDAGHDIAMMLKIWRATVETANLQCGGILLMFKRRHRGNERGWPRIISYHIEAAHHLIYASEINKMNISSLASR